MRIRTLVVDDERLARQRLRRMLEKHSEIEIIGECADGETAVERAREEEPDLLLLDIQMPRVDGFGVVEALGVCEGRPVVIFVTAFDEHAIRAFEACALDYLLKPVSPARLEKALARAKQHLEAFRAGDSTGNDAQTAKRFHVRNGQRTSFIAPEEIDWIEAGGNYAVLHVGAHNHLLRATMGSLENDLPKHFARTSRSAIVNLRRVKELQASGSNHFAIMEDEARVPVTGSVRELQERLRRLH